MPIQFRCKHCGQMLSISNRKIGATVNCPACTEPILVPDETPPTVQLDSVGAKPASSATPRASSRVATSVASPVKAAAAPARPVSAPTVNLWADEEPDEDAPRGVRESRLANDGLDMTPMVDVTFQLLIFFMITASFVTQKSLQTTPPEPNEDTGAVTVQLEDMKDESVIVNIDETGGLMVDDVPIEGASALVEALMAKMATEQKTELLIEADYNATHGAIIQVIDAGISAGMQNIRKTSRQDE